MASKSQGNTYVSVGEPVFWNDPDDGFASGVYQVITIKPRTARSVIRTMESYFGTSSVRKSKRSHMR